MARAGLAATERVFRAEYGRAVAVLTRVFGDIDSAEDAVQDAFAEAVRRWPQAGILEGYYLFHAIRADLLRRLGRDADARGAYHAAIAQTGNAAERAHLAGAKERLSRPGGVADG